MELVICQNCGCLLRHIRRDCTECGARVSKYSPTNLIALKAGGPTEKCIPPPPNDHLLLERVVTFRTTDRLSETSPCRGKKNCSHGVDGKREDDAAGSVVAARSFAFGAALDGNVVSARADVPDDSTRDTESGTAGGEAIDDAADLYERAQREIAFRSQSKKKLSGEEASGDHALEDERNATAGEDSRGGDEAESEGGGSSFSKKKKASEGKSLPGSKGESRSASKGKNDRAEAGSKVLSRMFPTSSADSSQKPPLKTVVMAVAIGIFVIGALCFTFMKPNAAPQQAQFPSQSSDFPSFPTQPTAINPEPAGVMPPNIAGNWKVQVEFEVPNRQPIAQEFIVAVRQNAVALEGRGADSGGAFTIRGTVSVNQPYTVEFQKAYDASNSTSLPINFRGQLANDPLKIADGPCVMRIARGGGVLQRARSDMLEGSWLAERTAQSPPPASAFPQPSGSSVTAILGVLLAVGISAVMFMKQKGAFSKSGISAIGKKAAPDEPEQPESDDR